MTFAPGRALRIRAGTTLVLQLHYTANGTGASDRTSVGVIYAKEAPRQEIRTSAFLNETLKLPPGSSDTEVGIRHSVPGGFAHHGAFSAHASARKELGISH